MTDNQQNLIVVPDKIIQAPDDATGGANQIPPRSSPSQVSMYLKCGQQWVYRYLEHLKSPPSGAMIRGRSLDFSANTHYRNVAMTGQGLTTDEFVQLTLETHDQEVADGAVMDIPKDESKDMMVIASSAYHKKIASYIWPRAAVDVQKRVEFTTPSGVPVTGIIDLITQSATGDGILDTKYKKKMPSQAEVDSSIQLGTYSMMENIPRVGLAVAKPTGETKIIISLRDEFHYRMLDATYKNVWENIHKGVAMRAVPGSWYCSEKWCGYWHICPYGAAGRGSTISMTNTFNPPPLQTPVKLTRAVPDPAIEEEADPDG